MVGDDDNAITMVLRLEEQLTGAGGPYELSGKVGEAVDTRKFVRGPYTLPQIYARAKSYGAAPLLLTDVGVHSYDEIFARSARISRELPQECQRIALCMERPEAWVAGLIAVTGAGSAAVLVESTQREATQVAQIVGTHCGILVDDAVALPEGDYSTEAAFESPRPDQEAIVLFSSGSTGTPKAIIHTHETIVAGLNSMMMLGALAGRLVAQNGGLMQRPERPKRPVTLLLTPLAYVAGYSAVLLAMMTGGSVAVTGCPEDPLRIAEAVQRYQAQAIVGLSRDTFTQLIRLKDAERLLASLRRLQVHGGFLPDGFVTELRTRFPNIQLMTGYGMSETGGAIASAPIDRRTGPRQATGRLSPAVAARIVDRHSLLLPEGCAGLLQVKGPMLMRGYADTAKSYAAWTDDGWFITGDIGRLLSGRWLEIISRDDASLTIEEVVTLRAIETVALSVEGISDALALHRTPGVIHLFVERSEGFIDDVTIDRLLRQAISGTDVAVINILAKFARTSSGKIDRAHLRTILEAVTPAPDMLRL